MPNASTGSSRFTQRFTEAQKTALLRSVLADGHTVAEARQLAHAGQLGVPAFDIGTYAYKLVADGRERFEASDETALERAVANELKGAELDALANIRAIRRGFTSGEPNDTARLALATRDLAAIVKARRDNAKAPKRESQQHAKPQNSASEAVFTGDHTLTNLLDLAKPHDPSFKTQGEGARTGSVSRASNAASAV